MSTKETLDKAYGSIPRELVGEIKVDVIPSWRGIKYYILLLRRKLKL